METQSRIKNQKYQEQLWYTFQSTRINVRRQTRESIEAFQKTRMYILMSKLTIEDPLHTYLTALACCTIFILFPLPFFSITSFLQEKWIFGKFLCFVIPSMMDIGKVLCPLLVATIAVHQVLMVYKFQQGL